MTDNPRIARKPGQPANSKKHSDLFTDENPKDTITGLKFTTVDDAEASVSKIANSGRSHAHKIQAAVAMEQRAKVMGKASVAAVYRKYINSSKKTDESLQQEEQKMKKFKDVETEDDSNDSLINIIANSLNRASNKDDTRGLLLLIAALGLLNVSKDGLPASVARRLASTSNRK